MRALGLLAVVLCGCDTSATLFPTRVVFLDARVLSAWPAREVNGTWEPVCRAEDGEAEGIITNVALMSSVKHVAPNAPIDEDVSIRPGEVVETKTVEGEFPFDIHLDGGGMSVEVTCLDPLAEGESSDDSADCQGTTPASVLESVRYAAHTPNRGDPNELLLLVDMSASMSGLVDDKTLLEPQPEQYSNIPGNLKDVASDGSVRRVAAAQELIRSLNPQDRVGVMIFAEDAGGGSGTAVPCGAGGLQVADGLAQCFGTNHDLWLGQGSALTNLNNRTFGRSNLWKALDVAYSYMADPERSRPKNASRHIIVLTDGPDTCQGEHLTPGTSPCSGVSADDFFERLAAANADPNAPAVHVHFLQFEAVGYPGRDPDQLVAACLGRGHHRFIDTNALRQEANVLSNAFGQSILDIRFALMGEWQIASSILALDATSGMMALGGRVVVTPDSHLVPVTTSFGFAGNVGWDRRPAIVQP